jgi:transcriptional regulator with XRE-family HTH domain
MTSRLNTALPLQPVSRASIGTHIRLLRQQLGLTQGALAEAIGVARSTVAFWETDRGDPEPDTLIRIAAALDVSMASFLDGMATQDSTEMVTIDEAFLLRLYRGCSVKDRMVLLRMAARIDKASETPDPQKLPRPSSPARRRGAQ